jgi:hypothetical protein
VRGSGRMENDACKKPCLQELVGEDVTVAYLEISLAGPALVHIVAY